MQAFTKFTTGLCSPASSSSTVPKWALKARTRPDLPPTHTSITDPKSGRTIYIDHSAQTTSWTPPAGLPYTPGVPLPYEQLWDSQTER
ncbi:hypothetical protein MMC30_008562 [Trapelia coarctata]|nr:hypothetical protein [Trapelia coarctata]